MPGNGTTFNYARAMCDDALSGVRTKFFHNHKMNRKETVKKVCSDPATGVRAG
jgi:hypothetical protein